MSEQLVQAHANPQTLHPAPEPHSGREQDTSSRDRDRGLLLIGLFKLSKSIFFFMMGLGVVHLLHAELGNEAMRLAQALHFDPEWHMVSVAVEKVDLIDAHRLREIGFFSFAYSVVSLVEGYGLMTCRIWAEYLTLSLTTIALPWEAYELVRDASWGRVALLVTNLLVLGYLILILQQKKKKALTSQPV
jgi:uncharacterized membrane protein (DUF2068 family)